MTDTPDMSPDDDVIDVIAIEPDEEQPGYEESEPAKRPVWPFALAGGVLLGVAIAFGSSWHFLKSEPYDATALQSEIAALRQQVAALEAKPEPVNPRVNLAPLQRRIAALEARPTVDPLNEEIVARMEALQAEGFEIPEIPELPDMSGLEARLDALETSVTELAARPAVVMTRPAAEEPTVDPATLPSLPVGALREGIAELGGSGFFRRALSRHVRVQGDDQPDRLVDLIVQDLEAGRPQAALAKFERLPPEVQSLARGWRADMEAALQ